MVASIFKVIDEVRGSHLHVMNRSRYRFVTMIRVAVSVVTIVMITAFGPKGLTAQSATAPAPTTPVVHRVALYGIGV